jgi:hypothetical protein
MKKKVILITIALTSLFLSNYSKASEEECFNKGLICIGGFSLKGGRKTQQDRFGHKIFEFNNQIYAVAAIFDGHVKSAVAEAANRRFYNTFEKHIQQGKDP